MVKKMKSILFHHTGEASQPSAQQECAINMNGVIMQCTKQSMLAIAPIESGFRKVIFIDDYV